MSKSRRKKLLRLFRNLMIGLLLLVIILLLFISPLSEYVIERYDEEWVGRQIEMDNLSINLLTGYIGVKGLKITEQNPAELFFQAEHIFANLTLHKLISKKIDVTEIGLVGPSIQIVQGASTFNFDDLTERFASEPAPVNTADPVSSGPFSYHIREIHIDTARITYKNQVLGNEIVIDSLNLRCPEVRSDHPDTHYELDLHFAEGGQVNSIIQLDHRSLDYQLQLDMKQLNLHLLLPYMADYLKVNDLQGSFSTAIALSGDASHFEDLSTSGDLLLEGFKMTDNQDRTVVGMERLLVGVDTMNMLKNMYQFNQIRLDAPTLLMERFPEDKDNLTNLVREEVMASTPDSTASDQMGDAFSQLPGGEYANIFVYLADYVGYFTRQYLESDYTADSIMINNATLDFTDYTLIEKYRTVFSDLNIYTQQFDSRSEKATFQISSTIDEAGKLEAECKVSPRDLLEMEMYYTIESLPVSGFNPYSKQYVAHPFFRGTLFYDGSLVIQNRQLDSQNKILIKSVEVGKRVHSPEAVKLPIRLAVSLLKDLDGNIELDVPVKGDLNDPKYKWWKVVFKVLKNLLLKAVTAPFKLLAGLFKVDESEIQELPFDYAQDHLEKRQIKSLNQVGKVLKGKKDFILEYYPLNNADIEREQIALQECASRYYREEILQEDRPFEPQDSAAFGLINLQDTNFLRFLLQGDTIDVAGAQALISPQERCLQMLDASVVDTRLRTLRQTRDSLIINYLIGEKKIAPERIRLWQADSLQVRDTNRLERPVYLFNFDVI